MLGELRPTGCTCLTIDLCTMSHYVTPIQPIQNNWVLLFGTFLPLQKRAPRNETSNEAAEIQQLRMFGEDTVKIRWRWWKRLISKELFGVCNFNIRSWSPRAILPFIGSCLLYKKKFQKVHLVLCNPDINPHDMPDTAYIYNIPQYKWFFPFCPGLFCSKPFVSPNWDPPSPIWIKCLRKCVLHGK